MFKIIGVEKLVLRRDQAGALRVSKADFWKDDGAFDQ
jgi:hypothetical protein